jgi:hypothetical protein
MLSTSIKEPFVSMSQLCLAVMCDDCTAFLEFRARQIVHTSLEHHRQPYRSGVCVSFVALLSEQPRQAAVRAEGISQQTFPSMWEKYPPVGR